MARVTKYHAVRDQLLDRLDAMAPGEQLEPERELAASLGVSRMTLRRALDELVAAGLVRRRHGAGVFAIGPKISPRLAATSFTEDMLSRGLTPSSRTLAFEIRSAGTRVGRHLAIDAHDPIVVVSRLRLADDEPMSIEELHTPRALVPDLVAADLETGSFYDLLTTRYDVLLAGGVQTIEPTVTDERESSELQVPVRSPALLFQRTSHDSHARVIEFVRSIYRGDRYQIKTELAAPTSRHPGTH